MGEYGNSLSAALTMLFFLLFICYSLYIATKHIKAPLTEKLQKYIKNIKNPNPLSKYADKHFDTIDYITSRNICIRICDIRQIGHEWNFLIDVYNFNNHKEILQIFKVKARWNEDFITWNEDYDMEENTINSGGGYKKHIIIFNKTHVLPQTLDIFYVNELEKESMITVKIPNKIVSKNN